MAPRKRKAATEEGKSPAPTGRVTRSSTRKVSEPVLVVQSPAKKKSKVKAETKPKKEEAANGNAENDVVGEEVEKKMKKKTTTPKTKTSTIIIEHCTQCRSFKKRAEEAKTGLKASLSGIEVTFNPEKPRRGCFEIRADNGMKFITLLDLKRPFTKMKDLDMDEVVQDIVKEMK